MGWGEVSGGGSIVPVHGSVVGVRLDMSGGLSGYDDPADGKFGMVVNIASQLAQSMASEDAQEDACQTTQIVEAFQSQLTVETAHGDDALNR